MNKEKLESAKNLFFIALGLDIAVTALVVISDFWGAAVLRDIGAGRLIADDAIISTLEFWDSFAKLMLLTILGVGLGLVKWLNTCYTYAKDSLGASGFKNEGWTAGGWIIPIFNLFKPYQVINELYKAGSPTYTTPDGWKKEAGSGLLLVWWIFWAVTHLIAWIVGKQMFKSAIRDDMTLQQSIGAIEFHAWFCIVFLIISGLWFVVAGSLTRRLLDRKSTTEQNSLLVGVESLSNHATTPSQFPTTSQTLQISPALQQSIEGHTAGTKVSEASTATTDFPSRSYMDASAEESYWAVAMAELDVGPRRTGLWAKVFAEADGNETKAKVAYLKLRVSQLAEAAHLEMTMLEEKRRQLSLEESMLANEVPEFKELVSEGYVPIEKHESHGLLVRKLANGIVAIQTKRQQRCYKDVSAAKSAIHEFVQDNRWTLRGLVVAIERPISTGDEAKRNSNS